MPAGRRELSAARASQLLQDESLRHSQRECRDLRHRLSALQRSLRTAERERRAAQVGMWGSLGGNVGIVQVGM